MVKNVLAVAGVDPSGGAGLLADVKTISALGGYACGVVTALTEQNTCRVDRVSVVDAGMLVRQMDAVFEDVRVDAVKIGMLGGEPSIRAVAECLRRWKPGVVVLDPVMTAKCGSRLLPQSDRAALVRELLPLVDFLTPNLPEAAELLGEPFLPSCRCQESWARRLQTMLSPKGWVLLKGGHADSPQCEDYLTDGRTLEVFSHPRHPTRNTHGTGCALSSALATLLAQGLAVPEAVEKACRYVFDAICAADRLEVGHGFGPVNHFFSSKH